MDEYELRPQKGLPHFRHRSIEAQIREASSCESIRRWWWEYLRLSKDYWLLCRTCVEGKPQTYDDKLAQIFIDFGNVHDGSFEDWWRRTGSNLFAEQELPPRVQQITSVEAAIPGSRAGKVLVEIPLQLTRETVQKQISEILDLYAGERPKHRYETSTSKYPIEAVLTRMKVIQQAHEVYCLHRELIQKPNALARLGVSADLTEHDSKANLFRIGKVYGLSPQNTSLVGMPQEVANRTKKMRSEVSRVIDRAETLLSFVEAGRFAVINCDRLEHKPRFSSKQDEAHAKLEAEWWALDFYSTLSECKIQKARELHYRGD